MSIWRGIMVLLSSGMKVEWCRPGTNRKTSLPNSSVYFHSQILALGVQLPLTDFVRYV